MTMASVDVASPASLAWRQLYLTYSTIFKAVERAIAPTGVTLPQALALATIKNGPGPITPSKLAHSLTQETQSVTGLIDRMEKQDWVKRVRDLPDRRAIRLVLTPAGEAKLAETLAPTGATEMRMFEALSTGELETLTALLERVHQGVASNLEVEAT
ncbi:MAG: MarR family winged helix-turn-helix transcriptional regulator [Dehalococcoidia bacterium]